MHVQTFVKFQTSGLISNQQDGRRVPKDIPKHREPIEEPRSVCILAIQKYQCN